MATIIGGKERDELAGDPGANNVLEGRANRDILWGDDFLIYGDEPEGLVFVGGGDRLFGGTGGDTIWGDTAAKNWRGTIDFTGGDDILAGGGGSDTLFGDGFAFECTGGTFQGGDDRLVGGKGDDILWGDGRGHDDGDFVGGADTFVFYKRQKGDDVIVDFRQEDGDLIEINGRGRDWDWIEARIQSDGRDTYIDLGRDKSLTLYDVSELTQDDFIFG